MLSSFWLRLRRAGKIRMISVIGVPLVSDRSPNAMCVVRPDSAHAAVITRRAKTPAPGGRGLSFSLPAAHRQQGAQQTGTRHMTFLGTM